MSIKMNAKRARVFETKAHSAVGTFYYSSDDQAFKTENAALNQERLLKGGTESITVDTVTRKEYDAWKAAGGDAAKVDAPVEEAPVEEAPVEEAPVEEAPVEEAPVEEAPVEAAPVQEAPVEEAPVEEAPVEAAPKSGKKGGKKAKGTGE